MSYLTHAHHLYNLISSEMWEAAREATTEKLRDYRESNTTTETTKAAEARATVVAQSNKQQAQY